MFKLALNAGHGMNTAGKRCMKTIDPKETREWVLNSRICSKIEALLSEYNGIEVRRMDDTTGVADYSIIQRTNTANVFGADLYLAIHHNAGINGGTGGGIEAYTYLTVNQTTKDWQTALYNALIAHTNLKGNRAQPMKTADFGECRQTKMPAVLLECGFMDSTADTPIILTEDFANKVAAACVEVIVSKARLTKKQSAAPVVPTAPAVPVAAPAPVAAAPSGLKVGDTVRMTKNAPIYGTNKKFAAFVYGIVLHVRAVSGDRITVSTVKTGPVTGNVDKKYLTKV